MASARDFRPPSKGGDEGGATFDFLGFTLHWQRTRSGAWRVAFRTRGARLGRAINAAAEWCALQNLRYAVTRAWKKWLDRRSQRAHMTWKRFKELLKAHPLPVPRSECRSGTLRKTTQQKSRTVADADQL